MPALVAILVVIIALGMLIAYYIGYAVGQREGYERGQNEGKRAGAVRAYAVGYDRGRHNRRVAETAEVVAEPAEPVERGHWIWTLLVSLILIVVATLAMGARFGF